MQSYAQLDVPPRVTAHIEVKPPKVPRIVDVRHECASRQRPIPAVTRTHIGLCVPLHGSGHSPHGSNISLPDLRANLARSRAAARRWQSATNDTSGGSGGTAAAFGAPAQHECDSQYWNERPHTGQRHRSAVASLIAPLLPLPPPNALDARFGIY